MVTLRIAILLLSITGVIGDLCTLQSTRSASTSSWGISEIHLEFQGIIQDAIQWISSSEFKVSGDIVLSTDVDINSLGVQWIKRANILTILVGNSTNSPTSCARFRATITYPFTTAKLCTNGNCVGNGGQFSKEYTYANALHYLKYAYATYNLPALVSNWTCTWCENTTQPFRTLYSFNNDVTNTFGYAGVNLQEIVISFRGTVNSVANILTDLEGIVKVPYPLVDDAEVGVGWYNAYQSVGDSVRAAVSSLKSEFPHFPIVVIGHSLGGALASVCSMDLNEQLGQSIVEWTFGSPRIGNTALAQYHNSIVGTTWRTVNQKDPVPHLPSHILGFTHVGTEVWFQNSFTDFEICTATEDPNCSYRINLLISNTAHHNQYLGLQL